MNDLTGFESNLQGVIEELAGFDDAPGQLYAQILTRYLIDAHQAAEADLERVYGEEWRDLVTIAGGSVREP